MEKNAPPPYSPSEPGFNIPPPRLPEVQQSTVIVHTTSSLLPHLGPTPALVVCPSCHAEITTTVEVQATMKTHIFALLLCLFGCWPCACVPYCMDSCQSQNHYCPNCKAYLGKYDN